MGKPDFSAWFVLQGLIAAMHHRPLCGPDNKPYNQKALRYLLPLAQEVSGVRALSRFVHALPYSLQYRIGTATTHADRLRHFYLRKKAIETFARETLSKGDVTQVVILGAGFDVLSFCLADEYPDVLFVEIDLPASQQFKKTAFARHGLSIPGNVEMIEGDLRDPLASILSKSARYDRQKTTLWVAEGFLMFIPEESVRKLFTSLKANSGAGSPFIFTTLPQKKYTSGFNYALQTLAFGKENCPLDWVIRAEDADKFVSSCTLQPVRQIHYTELHGDFIGEQNHLLGETIHIAKT